MQAEIYSVSRITGNSKETGNPFEMFKMSVLMPFEQVEMPNFQNRGAGWRLVDYDITPDLFARLSSGTKFPFRATLDLEAVTRGKTPSFRVKDLKQAA